MSQLITVPTRSQAVKNRIGQRRLLLLVIDDAWNRADAEMLRCGGPGCVHLLTTRLKDVAQGFAGPDQAAFVPELAPDPALALLQAHAPDACAADPEAARMLVQAVGGLPLALELLGGYLGARRHSATANLSRKALAKMATPEKRLVLACQRLGDGRGREVTLRETVLLSLAGLAEETGGEAAVHAFYALGAFAPKPAHFTWKAAAAVTECGEETIAWLLERNLVELVDADEGLLALDQSLADVARAELNADAVERHRDYYLAVVNEGRGDWHRIQQIYDRIVWAWEQAPRNDILVDFVWTLWRYQSLRGLMGEYFSWARQALVTAQKSDAQEKIASMLTHIGYILRFIGRPEEALRYYNEALPIRREVGDRAGEATTLNNLGGVYDGLGQPEEALRYYNEALPMHREVGNRAMEATTLNNLGGVYDGLGQSEEALRYYNEALPIMREVGDRAGEAVTRYNLMRVNWEQGKLADAFAEMKMVVELAAFVKSPYLPRFQQELAQLEAELAKRK